MSGLWLDSLDGQPLRNRVVLALVESQRVGMEWNTLGLAVQGRRSGVLRRFPAQYAEDDTGLVVVPGRPAGKTWWRNLPASRAACEVLLDGRWNTATGYLLLPAEDGHAEALTSYRDRWPKVTMSAEQPVVRFVLPQAPPARRGC